MKKYAIIAPHADDEIIGCFSLIQAGLVQTIIYSSKEVLKEVEVALLRSSVTLKAFYLTCIENCDMDLIATTTTCLFPDPTYETHPLHRKLGMLGEEILRGGGDVVFYTTNMLAPYIFEVKEPQIKRNCLDSLYPTKKALWEYDHRYFLFEGYTKWISPSKLCQD